MGDGEGHQSDDRTRRASAFDAVWEARKLIIEVDEDQHDEPTPLFDKPDVLTIRAVHRGKQRRIYDECGSSRANETEALDITRAALWKARSPRRSPSVRLVALVARAARVNLEDVRSGAWLGDVCPARCSTGRRA